MTKKQVIAVVEATGMQGGGLVRAIPADRESGLRVHALTRYVNSGSERTHTSRGGSRRGDISGCRHSLSGWKPTRRNSTMVVDAADSDRQPH
jgi:hypothetical protein